MVSFRKSLWQVSLLTVVSRFAGLARDAVLAHYLGATQSFVMDAYSMAFRLPNLVRQLFGEGALSAAFIPVFTDFLERGGRQAASRFMSLIITTLVALLAVLVLVVDGLLLVGRYFAAGSEKWHLIFSLAAVMFPFAIGVCLVAVLQAALNCCKHYVMPALAPIILNVFVIAGAIAGGIYYAGDAITQVYIIALAILVASVVEVLVQWPALRAVELVFSPVWNLKDDALKRVAYMVGPMVIAVGIVQLNVFLDALLANILSPGSTDVTTFQLWGRDVMFPMRMGAAAVLYYGQLIYMFPLGVFGVALATVIFPLLSLFAVRKDMPGLGAAAGHALRLSLFIGIPSGVGIILVCEPLVRLYLNHGQFAADPSAVSRTVAVASIYAAGIWAYSANHILVRAFYAMENIRTPLRVALIAAGVNFSLNLILVWPLAERGLALSTVIAAVLKTGLLTWLLVKRGTPLDWRWIGGSMARTLIATAVMAGGAWTVMFILIPTAEFQGRVLLIVQLAAGMVTGGALFVLTAKILNMSELVDLISLRPKTQS
jgi:putative peptidoglycan lipid II flippase